MGTEDDSGVVVVRGVGFALCKQQKAAKKTSKKAGAKKAGKKTGKKTAKK